MESNTGGDLRVTVVGNLPSNTIPISSSVPHVDEELQNLLKLIEWPLPPGPITFESSTDPKSCLFVLLHPRSTYIVGEKLEVLITARDHKGQPKTYGGDFFQAKLHSTKLKAGVSGSITDHYNGTYTATFLLMWPGDTEITVKLVHSSEAISILHEKRDFRPDKSYFFGYFELDGISERVECNVDIPGRNVCKYHNPSTGEIWVCVQPKKLPCDSYREHSDGGARRFLTKEEEQFLKTSPMDQIIPSKLQPLIVLPQNATQKNDTRGSCVPGLQNPDPSGFYYQDVWESCVCLAQSFNHPSNVASCLGGKIIYMFGDSTLRQWWEYLVGFVPSLKEIDLHVLHQTGPLLATDAEHNYLVQWRAHQKPLRMQRAWIQDLHYIASELDQLGGRKGMVIVFTCWAHFSSYPVSVYIERLRGIRHAVIRLLKRSPETKVLIKSANTGYNTVHVNVWLSFQLDTVMRAMFSKLPVAILDAWQMTSSHRLPENLHPHKLIVKNEVDLMLSFICLT
ncbi:NXPE family member 3-like [Discoglossus pictus]